MMGLEPTTFCMASRSEGVEPGENGLATRAEVKLDRAGLGDSGLKLGTKLTGPPVPRQRRPDQPQAPSMLPSRPAGQPPVSRRRARQDRATGDQALRHRADSLAQDHLA